MNRAIVALEVVSIFGIEAAIELVAVGVIAVIACVLLVPASPSYATTPDVAPALTNAQMCHEMPVPGCSARLYAERLYADAVASNTPTSGSP
jgi:hypothetical protein